MSWLRLRREALLRGKVADLELLRRSLIQLGRKFVVVTAARPDVTADARCIEPLRVIDRA